MKRAVLSLRILMTDILSSKPTKNTGCEGSSRLSWKKILTAWRPNTTLRHALGGSSIIFGVCTGHLRLRLPTTLFLLDHRDHEREVGSSTSLLSCPQ
ncbi:hypothetical protein BD779DRAFT_1078848 [Infundibulicybe gibba]|nr:hypothetical protein BD779DRAFT_1078848 [Infundibulicybe gibba]